MEFVPSKLGDGEGSGKNYSHLFSKIIGIV